MWVTFSQVWRKFTQKTELKYSNYTRLQLLTFRVNDELLNHWVNMHKNVSKFTQLWGIFTPKTGPSNYKKNAPTVTPNFE